MKRLIYAPKAFVFVRSENMGGRIYDLSTDVVSGSVTRNDNDVSTAEVVFRNRFNKWIRDPETGNSIFLPMDMITIFLQRVAGKPIQVFTGYLDGAPYYQGLPDNARLRATCTLKRLGFTWFDPGLDLVTAMINHMEGWTYNSQTGEAMNPAFLYSGEQVDDTAFTAAGGTSQMHDGGFGKLLHDFLILIGGLNESDVIISDLPAHLPQVAAKLFKNINDAADGDLTQLGNALGQIMGIKVISSTTPASSANGSDTNAIPPATLVKIEQVKTAASEANVPPLIPIFAAVALTGFKSTYSHTSTEGDAYGYGLYALRPDKAVDPAQGVFDPTNVTGLAAGSPINTIGGHSIPEIMDVPTATEVFCKMLNKTQGSWVQAARNGDRTAMVTWIQNALGGRTLKATGLADAFTQAQQYIGTTEAKVFDSSPSQAIDPANISFTDANLQGRLSDQEKATIRDKYGSAKPWLASILSWAKDISTDLTVANQAPGSENRIIITGTPANVSKLYSALLGKTDIDEVVETTSADTKVARKGVQTSNTRNGALASAGGFQNTISVTWSSQPASSSSSASTTSAPVSSTTGTATFEQLAAFSANAAFASQFSFPTNYLESHLLTGDRSLMNDISVLDAVKQFSQASLRNLMSLPDGRYLAYYPDYFGSVRGPYWQVSDLETTNFGIQLNDDALATHVYVVGDTFAADGQITLFDEVSTRGVASISQSFMLQSFINSYDGTIRDTGAAIPGRLDESYKFLQHYGARPHREDNPIIRNVFFEFLLAWQRFIQLWASQFATDCQFTFQPEVMAGGLVAFPDHDIQMYVGQVTHTFNYESGFTTQAVLSSPALIMSGARPADGVTKPGFALAGNVNTVGASGGG